MERAFFVSRCSGFAHRQWQKHTSRGQEPICLPTGGNVNRAYKDARDDPRDGVAKHEMLVAIPMGQHKEYPAQTDETGAKDGKQGWSQRFSQAAHARRRYLITGGDPLEGKRHVDARRAVMDDLWVGGEDGGDGRTKQHKHHVGRKNRRTTQQETEAEDAAAPVHLACAVVLAREGDGRGAEGHLPGRPGPDAQGRQAGPPAAAVRRKGFCGISTILS